MKKFGPPSSGRPEFRIGSRTSVRSMIGSYYKDTKKQVS